MSKPMLGILGGMGAFAGQRLVKRAFEMAVEHGAKKDSDFPRLLYYNLPAKGLDPTGVHDSKTFLQEVRAALSRMEMCGCHRLMIACMSAYAIYPKLQDGCSAEILNVPEFVAYDLCNHKKIGVLCSESCRKAGVWDRAFGRKEIECIYPTNQAVVTAYIESAITDSYPSPVLMALGEVCLELQDKAAAVLAGCTELQSQEPVYNAAEIGLRHLLGYT